MQGWALGCWSLPWIYILSAFFCLSLPLSLSRALFVRFAWLTVVLQYTWVSARRMNSSPRREELTSNVQLGEQTTDELRGIRHVSAVDFGAGVVLDVGPFLPPSAELRLRR